MYILCETGSIESYRFADDYVLFLNMKDIFYRKLEYLWREQFGAAVFFLFF